MKNRLLVLMILAFLAPTTGRGDAIPPGYHSVQRDVIISNIQSFPDIAIIAFIKGPMIPSYEVYQVQENVPLDKGYKFNTMNIFVVSKTYLDNAGGISNINFENLAPSKLNSDFLEPSTTTAPDANPLTSEKITYEIQGKTDTALSLRISERVLHYNDGTPDRVENY